MSLIKEELELKAAEAELAAQETLAEFPAWKRYTLYTLAIALVPGYVITKNISYRTWQKNHAPMLVQAKIPTLEAQPLTNGQVMVLTTGNGSKAAYVDITNPNLDLSAKNIAIAVMFYGPQKEIVYTHKETIELLPDQTKHIVIARIQTPGSITSASVELPAAIKWQKKISIPNLVISKSLPTLDNPPDQNTLSVEGKITNRNQYLIKKVRLQFFAYNRLNQVIGVTQRDEFDLEPNSPRAYKVFLPNLPQASVGKVDVVVDTNLLDPDNLKPIASQTSPSSDLSRPTVEN